MIEATGLSAGYETDEGSHPVIEGLSFFIPRRQSGRGVRGALFGRLQRARHPAGFGARHEVRVGLVGDGFFGDAPQFAAGLLELSGIQEVPCEAGRELRVFFQQAIEFRSCRFVERVGHIPLEELLACHESGRKQSGPLSTLSARVRQRPA